ncbi:unnamed protein product [Caenorhabditis auriculariae]|uniref:Uncharacterized protein n=1 Tax=Caenorhabditis auriculariae TaxID=2777116 RepID=A0A8S1GUY3_9PELO|nr:unnamed protein product [Caenorhabditis auriculariae]
MALGTIVEEQTSLQPSTQNSSEQTEELSPMTVVEKVSKERNMERLKRMRIKGELPPVFPNSWFCVGESALLKKGDVQQIAALEVGRRVSEPLATAEIR